MDDIMSGRAPASGEQAGLGCARASLLRGLLYVASVPYGLAAGLRRRCYRAGLLPSKPAGLPVISVGNVTAGGTGKTPMAAWAAGRLKQAGASCAILTRGYKSVAGISDEAELLARTTGCPVIVNADRLAGAHRAARQGAQVLVMDDGFQHLRLRRDLDVVLIDATRPFGYGYCLPRGLLREPLTALADADAVVITHCDEAPAGDLEGIRRRLSKLSPRASVHLAAHRPVCVIGPDGRRQPAGTLAGRRVAAFCGIGNPRPFFDTLRRLGAELAVCKAFDDHVAYGAAELEQLRLVAARGNAELAITTQKDHVKLQGADLGRELWQLAVEIEIVEGGEELAARMIGVWRGGGR